MENKTENMIEDTLSKLKDVRVEQRYNSFVQKTDGFELNRVCEEMGLSQDFVKSYTYNGSDKRELIGFILSEVEGKAIAQKVDEKAKATLKEVEDKE